MVEVEAEVEGWGLAQGGGDEEVEGRAVDVGVGMLKGVRVRLKMEEQLR